MSCHHRDYFIHAWFSTWHALEKKEWHMKGNRIVFLSALFCYTSCHYVNPKVKLNQSKQQLEMEQKSYEASIKDTTMKMELVELYKNVQTNLVLCDNFEYTISVDRLLNNSIRYVCWKKPKSTLDTPDFIIENGIMVDHRTTDRKEYIFSNSNSTYSIEKIISNDSNHTVHIFLEIRIDDGKGNYAWKMRDLSKIKV